MNVLVTGAGGFIGSHLVSYLKDMGYWVRGVDIKKPEFSDSVADEFKLLDLRNEQNAREAVRDADIIYHLAATMGGIGFITENHAICAADNTRMDLNMLDAAKNAGAWRFFFSSSACVYPHDLQSFTNVVPLREPDAWPAEPEEGYGLSKLYTEKLCQYYHEDHGLDVRIARFHNILGPYTTYEGGREKAPAAICRKVARAHPEDEVSIWGDGSATRSFLYINDCVEGIYRIMHSQCSEPINLGSEEMVSIRELAQRIVDISGKNVTLVFDPSKPEGVRGRNSDNTKLREVTNWEPSTSLNEGLERLFSWINSRVGV